MKKQDIMHFFDEHKTELICLGVGIGIGAYAVYIIQPSISSRELITFAKK